MNLLQSGLQWLSEKQSKHVSSETIYCRNENTYVVNAVLGRTRYEIVDENGFKIAGHAIDFLIAASDLPLEPRPGDRIVVSIPVKNVRSSNHEARQRRTTHWARSGQNVPKGTVHEVIDLGGDGCWSWCDPHGIRRRIHCQTIGVRL